MTLRKPLVELIEDKNIRESFTWLYEYLISVPILNGGFKFFEVTLNSSTAEKVVHKLGFVPKDVIVTQVSNGATVSFDFAKFDIDTIELQASAPCVVRFLAGRYDV